MCRPKSTKVSHLVMLVGIMLMVGAVAPAAEQREEADIALLLGGANTQPIAPAQLALRLLSAALQAAAADGSPLADASFSEADDKLPSGEAVWRVAVREFARVVLEGGRLDALLAEPALAAAVGERLRDVYCASATPADDAYAAPPLLVLEGPLQRRAPEPRRGTPGAGGVVEPRLRLRHARARVDGGGALEIAAHELQREQHHHVGHRRDVGADRRGGAGTRALRHRRCRETRSPAG